MVMLQMHYNGVILMDVLVDCLSQGHHYVSTPQLELVKEEDGGGGGYLVLKMYCFGDIAPRGHY